MLDGWPIIVTIDANAAIGSNRYFDPVKTNGRWVEQAKPGPGGLFGPETMAYEYRGATANALLVFLAAWSGGGSGTFYYLHVVDAASNRAFDKDGSTYSRLDLTLVRTYILGDRWQGDIRISGNSIRVVTNASRRAPRRVRDNRCAQALRWSDRATGVFRAPKASGRSRR